MQIEHQNPKSQCNISTDYTIQHIASRTRPRDRTCDFSALLFKATIFSDHWLLQVKGKTSSTVNVINSCKKGTKTKTKRTEPVEKNLAAKEESNYIFQGTSHS